MADLAVRPWVVTFHGPTASTPAARQSPTSMRWFADVFAVLGLALGDDQGEISAPRRLGWESRVDPEDMF